MWDSMQSMDSVTVRDVRPVDLRSLMAAFPTGVAVVTTKAEGCRPWGMTCTSLCSVSLRPAVLLVCLRSGSPTLEATLESGGFTVNLLKDDARHIAELFASGAPDRFSRIDWCEPTGCAGPHLHTSSHSVADCVVTHSASVGDHEVVFGEVVTITHRATPVPLLYGLRRYASWQAQEYRTSGIGE